MSLRTRLFLLFGGLMALLMGAQWWMLRSFSRDLDLEVEAVAVSVGNAVASLLEQARTTAPRHRGADPATDSADCPETFAVMASLEEESLELPAAEAAGSGGTRIVKVIRHAAGAELGEEEARTLEVGAQAISETPPGEERHEHRVLRVLHASDSPASTLLLRGPQLAERIHLPRASLEQRLEGFSHRMLAGSGALLLAGLVVAGLLSHGLSRPLRQLAAATRRVGEGELGVRVETAGRGEVGETLAAFNQMSARLRQLEEDARRLRAGQHLSELGEVSRGLAHSLRNPLNALGLALDRLAEADLEVAQRQLLAATARQQIRRVDGSLRSFLALASSGGLAEEEVDVATLLQDVALEALQGFAGSRDSDAAPPRIETRIAPGLAALRAVRPELRAVLQALVVNAVEASPPGGLVTLSARADGERLRLEVEDQGPGLPPEVRRRLFSPHVTTKEHGSGMGLFLAHRIAVNRYGGRLEVDSSAGGGTRVAVELGPRQGEAAAEPA